MCDSIKFCFIYYIYVEKYCIFIFYTTCKLFTISFTGICEIFFRVRTLATEQSESSGRAVESSDGDETGLQQIHSECPQHAAHSPLSRRMKLKRDNPEKYQKVKETDKARASLYRRTLSEGKKQESRDKARIRMKRYRERKASESKPKLTVTEIRKKWRGEKRRQRKVMSPEKKLPMKKRKIIKSALGLLPNSTKIFFLFLLVQLESATGAQLESDMDSDTGVQLGSDMDSDTGVQLESATTAEQLESAASAQLDSATTGEQLESVTGEELESATGEQLESATAERLECATTGEQLESATGEELESSNGVQLDSATTEQRESATGEQLDRNLSDDSVDLE